MKTWNQIEAGDRVAFIRGTRVSGTVHSVEKLSPNNKIFIDWSDAPPGDIVSYILGNDYDDPSDYWAKFIHYYSDEKELLFLTMRYGKELE